jgi:hypothetical protein
MMPYSTGPVVLFLKDILVSEEVIDHDMPWVSLLADQRDFGMEGPQMDLDDPRSGSEANSAASSMSDSSLNQHESVIFGGAHDEEEDMDRQQQEADRHVVSADRGVADRSLTLEVGSSRPHTKKGASRWLQASVSKDVSKLSPPYPPPPVAYPKFLVLVIQVSHYMILGFKV